MRLSMCWGSALAAAGVLLACKSDPAPKPIDDDPRFASLEFVADVDPAKRSFDLRPTYDTAARGGAASLGTANVVRDGVSFAGPADSIELVTVSTALDADGTGACGFASTFCADVVITNFYRGTLGTVYSEINSISPAAGHGGLGSDPPAFGLSDTLGLWAYGDIDARDLHQRTWIFGDDGTSYRVRGTIRAQLPVIAPAFGYTSAGIAFSYEDIAATGAPISAGDDALSSQIPIGFAFDFFGTSVTQLRASSNGFLVFDAAQTSDGCCSGQLLPDPAGPNGIVAGFWEDLEPSSGSMQFETRGTSPSQRFIAQYTAVPHFGGGPAVSFQIVLFEGSNNLEIRLLDAPSDGGEHGIGIERADGADGVDLAHGNVSFTNTAFRITHP